MLRILAMKYIVDLDSYSFSIGDTRKFGTYLSGGTVTEVKTQRTIQFVTIQSLLSYVNSFFDSQKSFVESLRKPEIVSLNGPRDCIGENLHVAFQALSHFIERYHAKPKAWDDVNISTDFDFVDFYVRLRPMQKRFINWQLNSTAK